MPALKSCLVCLWPSHSLRLQIVSERSGVLSPTRSGLNCNKLQLTPSQNQKKNLKTLTTTIKPTTPCLTWTSPPATFTCWASHKTPPKKCGKGNSKLKHSVFFSSRMIWEHKDEPRENLCLHNTRINTEFGNRSWTPLLWLSGSVTWTITLMTFLIISNQCLGEIGSSFYTPITVTPIVGGGLACCRHTPAEPSPT